jgi:cyclic beta-1,2-glucan synthetase
VHLDSVAHSLGRQLARVLLWLVFLPYEAARGLDAAPARAGACFFSRHHLLEWQTAAAVESGSDSRLSHVLRRMGAIPLLALGLELLLLSRGMAHAALVAAPVLLLWFVSPLVAWWVSLPLKTRAAELDGDDRLLLRRVARLTWRYFEVLVGPQENWLPPDNLQEAPDPRVAHRTSPTDMGLALLANLSAHDLGYLSAGQLLDRTGRTLDSMEQLERHRGHFLNWYDTITRRALRPKYISTVDSGNLVGHVRVLRIGLLELAEGPLLPACFRDGLQDTLQVLGSLHGTNGNLATVGSGLRVSPDTLSAQSLWLEDQLQATRRLVGSIDAELHPEAAWWVNAFEQQLGAFQADLAELAPWLVLDETILARLEPSWRTAIDHASGLTELERLARQAADALAGPQHTGLTQQLATAFRLGADRIAARLRLVKALARRCTDLAEADFAFLYDPMRKLLVIGYDVDERRPDSGVYDLLASEARLASYIAIAEGQLPFDHWFALGRRLTTSAGKQVLLSWSGSMFEYLMPRLVMPHYEGTLLDQTCNGAVASQIAYGGHVGTPWGISESSYNLKDTEGTYQYRAFGVPALGLQRGLADELVIAPYAALLALLVDPRRASTNLRRMEKRNWLGSYGFYEAIDFTPSRLRGSAGEAVVHSFFAHHQGMGLLALEHALLGPRMQERFLGNPDLNAAAMLLLERVPRTGVRMDPRRRDPRVTSRAPVHEAAQVMRTFSNPNTPLPQIQLLSNGRYHVMVSAAGAGYSRWNELAMTRWREDATSESDGIFCYLLDPETKHGWSNTFQPTLRVGQRYLALFSAGRAEFRRQDDQVETHTEIAVSIEDDLEVRRIRLTNRADRARRLEVTSYAEVVLAPGVSDELHRVFSNLFVQAEILADQGAILMTRRPRTADEQPPWLFCMMPQAGGDPAACSFETDRARFIGRGRSLRQPVAQDGSGLLSGTTGAVLDPCAAIRRSVDLAPGGTAQLDLILGMAATREAALALIAKHQDHRMVDRVLEGAPTQSRTALDHLGIREDEAPRHAELASAVVFADRVHRAPGSILRRNRRGQSGLWRFGIPGDLPIVLLRIGNADKLDLVRDLLAAHAYWRLHGLPCDLVIWNDDTTGYRRELGERIQDLVATGPEAQLVDKPGGIFVRQIEQFQEEDRVLLQSVARVVIRDTDGPLADQLERWTRMPQRALMLPPARQATRGCPRWHGPRAATT